MPGLLGFVSGMTTRCGQHRCAQLPLEQSREFMHGIDLVRPYSKWSRDLDERPSPDGWTIMVSKPQRHPVDQLCFS